MSKEIVTNASALVLKKKGFKTILGCFLLSLSLSKLSSKQVSSQILILFFLSRTWRR